MQFIFPSIISIFIQNWRCTWTWQRVSQCANRVIRWGIKSREISRARTNLLILAANFIFAASQAKWLCQYRITAVFKRWPWQWHVIAAEKRKTRAKIRAWPQARASAGWQSCRRSWNWHCHWMRQKLRSLEDTRLLKRCSRTSTFCFKRRSPIRHVDSMRIKSRQGFTLKNIDLYTLHVSLVSNSYFRYQ